MNTLRFLITINMLHMVLFSIPDQFYCKFCMYATEMIRSMSVGIIQAVVILFSFTFSTNYSFILILIDNFIISFNMFNYNKYTFLILALSPLTYLDPLLAPQSPSFCLSSLSHTAVPHLASQQTNPIIHHFPAAPATLRMQLTCQYLALLKSLLKSVQFLPWSRHSELCAWQWPSIQLGFIREPHSPPVRLRKYETAYCLAWLLPKIASGALPVLVHVWYLIALRHSSPFGFSYAFKIFRSGPRRLAYR